ncbi:protein of unknown function DUF368 [Chloroherpeton thalassium ATCC 35110]|uniref:Integral membrane protein n=1 Tax=Chloroherpeton thalassium (strain ATCC 35110 / GB-78) TaxID=517418 RepID=B3QS04_CHLT3|nr:DUF368 domain-containing protein [Chloroherpeton thalassium]ACF13949.1 protein of unknown function DUF368 [Chloroherpeton thalassium ATCC 35110]
MKRTLKEHLVISLKGIAMGAADVVPGVSGGTIAFITGIYEELIDTLKNLGGSALKPLFKLDIKGFWEAANLNFLIALLAGIGLSVLSLSRGILYLLEFHSQLLWAFFFGLIVGSAVIVLKKIKRFHVGLLISGIFGIAIAYLITSLTPTETPTALWFIFLSGAIAICAMILPGISGSFILLLMGKYQYILGSIKEMKVEVILTFLFGCVGGLLGFSHVLSWLLKKYHDITVALLAGFMIGSLNKVWPWKITIETYTDSHGNLKPLVQENVLPHIFLNETGKDPQLIFAILLAAFGLVLVYAIEHFSNSQIQQPAAKA